MSSQRDIARSIVAGIFQFIVENRKGTKYEHLNASQITSDILRMATGEFIPVHDVDMRCVGIVSFRAYSESKRLVVSEIICKSRKALRCLVRQKLDKYPGYDVIGKRHKFFKCITEKKLKRFYYGRTRHSQ